MAAPIQAEKTSAKAAWASRRALGIVVAVVLAHVVILAALTLFTPKPIPLLEQPKPIAVRFVEITPPKPEQPIPPQPKPKELPKKTIKPKEVKVVKPEAKPKPKTVSKAQKVVSTKTTSEQQQAKVTPINEEIKSKTEPESKAEPETKTQAEETKAKAKPESEKKSSSEPVLVEGVSYVKPPRLSITDRDLKGQARTVRLKINISTSGKVEAVQVVSSSGIAALDQKVANALKRATFTPHRVNGVAVPSYTIQPFELNLPK